MANNIRWTKEEESVILSCVKKSSGNLHNAFKEASTKIDRSLSAIEYRWYTKLKKEHYCFLTIGDKAYANSKNSKAKGVKVKKTLFQKLLDLFK